MNALARRCFLISGRSAGFARCPEGAMAADALMEELRVEGFPVSLTHDATHWYVVEDADHFAARKAAEYASFNEEEGR